MKKSLENKKRILITAGPTIEPIDAVRYISNYSTGVMGYTLAEESVKLGHKVCLISGPTNIKAPSGVQLINVSTAREMKKAVLNEIDESQGIIMTAAVCDFRPQKKVNKKIKKKETLTLKLVKNPDILEELKKKKNIVKIGFALESEDLRKNGIKKLQSKELDLIVINAINKNSSPFGGNTKTDYIIAETSNSPEKFKKQTKKQIAKVILKKMGNLFRKNI